MLTFLTVKVVSFILRTASQIVFNVQNVQIVVFYFVHHAALPKMWLPPITKSHPDAVFNLEGSNWTSSWWGCLCWATSCWTSADPWEQKLPETFNRLFKVFWISCPFSSILLPVLSHVIFMISFMIEATPEIRLSFCLLLLIIFTFFSKMITRINGKNGEWANSPPSSLGL